MENPIRRYRPNRFQDYKSITMSEIETFYNAGIVRQTGTAVFITAPLLVCMALYGQVDEISYLLARFPLVDVSGWTPELDEEEGKQEKSYFCVIDSSGNCVFEKKEKPELLYALAWSEIHGDEFRLFKNSLRISGVDMSEMPAKLQDEIKEKIIVAEQEVRG